MPKTTNATAINPTPKKVNATAVDRVEITANSFRQHFEGLSGNGDGNKRNKSYKEATFLTYSENERLKNLVECINNVFTAANDKKATSSIA